MLTKSDHSWTYLFRSVGHAYISNYIISSKIHRTLGYHQMPELVELFVWEAIDRQIFLSWDQLFELNTMPIDGEFNQTNGAVFQIERLSVKCYTE